jgi:hypothetical protein
MWWLCQAHSRVGHGRRAVSQPPVSRSPSPNRTYTFCYVSGSPEATAYLSYTAENVFVHAGDRTKKNGPCSVSTEYSSGFETPRPPAPLRHVDGFPVLRLLQGLRPASCPSPVSTDSLYDRQTRGGSHVPVHNPYGWLGACFTPGGPGERQEGVNLSQVRIYSYLPGGTVNPARIAPQLPSRSITQQREVLHKYRGFRRRFVVSPYILW